jgi:hypothetical protein
LRTQFIEARAQYPEVRNRKSNSGTDNQVKQPRLGTCQVPANEGSDNRQNDSHDWGHQLPFMGLSLNLRLAWQDKRGMSDPPNKGLRIPARETRLASRLHRLWPWPAEDFFGVPGALTNAF